MAVRDQVAMPSQNPKERIKNFSEVALGYTEEMALEEASRCMTCKTMSCVKSCPVSVNIPKFISLIKEKAYIDALNVIKESNALPAVCGRVCPQEKQCQSTCIFNKMGKPIAIGRLERFVADYEAKVNPTPAKAEPKDPSLAQYKVAVVGCGPSGITVAATLAQMGYSVTIFEALHKTGGVLRYGIPEFRLPRNILDRELDYVQSLGVKIFTNIVVGRTFKVRDLFDEGFVAVYVASGAGTPKMLGIPGENLSGVFSGNEWLTRVNLMRAYNEEYSTPLPKSRKTVVIGAGNTAMDCTRTALRSGAEEVSIVYRRGRSEMPARAEEIDHAEEEGVKFNFLVNPAEFLGDEKGVLRAVKCEKMELGEPDASGRRRPVGTGEYFEIEADCAIVALGQNPNPLIRTTTEGLQTQPWGGIIINEETGMTSIPGMFAGGDAVTGEATVISAMGAGKVAAKGIDEYIKNKIINK
ncbi:MAG: NADPH-dependent glutamate synthase [Armatimonadetes bacterium]|nr:NADPH-dependent glutamate synthase [Candidatus Hippobium faecium]